MVLYIKKIITGNFFEKIMGLQSDTIYNVEYFDKQFYLATENGLLMFNGSRIR